MFTKQISFANKYNLNTFSVTEHDQAVHNLTKRATASEIIVECRRTNIMGSLIQNASPFLFPCTIEYSLICSGLLPLFTFQLYDK